MKATEIKTAALFTAAAGLLGASLLLSPGHPPAQAKPAPRPAVPASVHSENQPQPQTDEDGGRIQIALLLDTSSSMDGLIDQARSQLWSMVNELQSARRSGVRPTLEIALYEYGHDSLPAAEGYLRQVTGFTNDLDSVSEKLFALSTNGGSEFAGHAIRAATRSLEWSPDRSDLKFIFIAGNESFRQGEVNPDLAVQDAAERGITVNTVYCGSAGDSVSSEWRSGAALADGRFLAIDQNQKLAHIQAPQDKEIAELGVALNNTYIPFGTRGTAGAQRQMAQDSNSRRLGMGSFLSRMSSKGSAYYSNSGWDLVDAVEEEEVELDALDEGQLPQNMRTMDAAERKAHLEKMKKERARIQSRIQALSKDRAEFVKVEQEKHAKANQGTLGLAMIDALKGEAKAKGYSFE